MNSNQPRSEGMGMLDRQGDRYTRWNLRDRYLDEEVNESPIFTVDFYRFDYFKQNFRSC